MTPQERLPRSPELMSRHDTGLLVVDMQERLLQVLPDAPRLVWNVRRLLDGARVLGIPSAGSEQYPQGLGPTVAPLRERLAEIPAKLTFSCGGLPTLFDQFRTRDIDKLLLVGIEAHVCVQQTALDLLASGFRVYVAIDAVGSRHELDCQTALRRIESAGAVVTTTEAALFEWCDQAGTPEFKQISALVRESFPPLIDRA
jgi:nicotinamidase-related amidase